MQLSFVTPLWLYRKPVDFRKQLDGLIILIADELSCDPCSGELFIFRNRLATKIKLLWYDTNGFWLCYKRLEKGKLIFPSLHEGIMEVTRDQLGWLLSGLDILKQPTQKSHKARYFY